MRIALLLFGFSFIEDVQDGGKKNKNIDYVYYSKNIKRVLIDHMASIFDAQVDVFAVTNPNQMAEEIRMVYQLKDMMLCGGYRDYKIAHGLEMIMNYGVYDFVMVTRFDIQFSYRIPKNNLDLNKLNVFSILEKPDVICDNFYFFPFDFTNQMSVIFKDPHKYSDKRVAVKSHGLGSCFEKHFGLNYIRNENAPVHALSSYRINDFLIYKFVINRYTFRPGHVVQGHKEESELSSLGNNGFLFKKKIDRPSICQWLGFWLIRGGRYKVSALLEFNKSLPDNVVSFKKHAPTRYTYINGIEARKKIHFSEEFTSEELELAIFILDDVDTTVDVLVENIIFEGPF